MAVMLGSTSVPKTRITIPRRRSDLISRQRLLDLMDQLLDKKLILLTAPAGYGKTSLLVEYANSSVLPVAWYSVDALDFEPQRFISNFILAIANRFPQVGQRSLTALQNTTASLDVDYIAGVLINDLFDNISEHFVVVVDDFHLVAENNQIKNFISRFIQEVDENCHIVLTSRTLLAMPVITLMAARGDVTGLDFEELAFRADEIIQLYHQNQEITLSQPEADEIQEKTEGWITGILLVSHTNLKRPIGRPWLGRMPGVRLEDYFEQLVNQQSPELIRFLLRTSLLDEFNPQVCREVIGRALGLEDVPWEDLHRQVQQRNLFTLVVGEDGTWLRYHPLFLEYLQSRARRDYPLEVDAIDGSLARLYIENADWNDAFAIYRRLGATRELAALVETAGPELVVKGRLQTLSSWLDTLPPELLSARPFIVSLQGSLAALTGNTELALTLFNQAVNGMKLPADRQNLARALSWRAALHRMMGNLNLAIADSRESLALIENDPDMHKVKAEGLRGIGLCLNKQGKLKDAITWLNQALSTSLSIGDVENANIIRLGLGATYENLGRYSEAKSLYQSALEHWQKTENNVWLANLYNNLGVLEHLTGNFEQAILCYEKALHHARVSGSVRYEAFVLAGIGDVYADLEATPEARAAYQQARVIAERIQVNYLRIYLNAQEASLYGQDGDEALGYKLIESARQLTRRESPSMEAYLCDLEFAGLKIRQGEPNDALPFLEKAAAFFETEGQKVQLEKSDLYLALAYGQTGEHEKLLKSLLRLLAHLNTDTPSASLIAAANRHYDFLTRLRELDYLGGQLDDLFERIDQFRSQLPLLRRHMRQHPLAVPFGPPAIVIRALGKMQVRVNSRLVTSSDWQTQSARDLFFLILARPEGLNKEEIGLVLWPDASPSDLRFRIKNTVYRLRHALGKDVILLDQDSYRFNNALDYEYDVEQFLKEYAQAQQVKEPLQKLNHYREAIKLYKGAYLPEINETWVDSPRHCLQQNYLAILIQVAELYLGMANYDLALEYCQRALDEDNCLEAAYRLSFRIYSAMGNRAAVVRQYQRCVEVLHREINTEPSPQTQTLYHDLLK